MSAAHSDSQPNSEPDARRGDRRGAERDVVIVGAGLAGSSVAASLARLGWDVLVVERDRLPRHKVCGEFLSPEAHDALRGMSLHEAVRAESPAEMRHARVVSPRGRSVRASLPGIAWGVSRFALDGALADAARRAGAEMWTGAAVTSRWRGDEGACYVEVGRGAPLSARARGSDGAGRDGGRGPVVVRARAVILACGRHFPKKVAGTLEGAGAPSSPTSPPNTAGARGGEVGLKCHYEGVTARPEVELYFFPGGYAGIAPTETGAVNVCLLVTRETFQRVGAGKEAVLRAAERWNPALGDRLAGGRLRRETAVAVSPVATDRPPVPWSGGAPRLGDAAAMLPPFVGDGMAAALRSAELCAPLAHQYLSGRLSLSEWEGAYRAAWRDEFARRLRVGRRLGRLLRNPAVAEAGLALAARVPPLAGHFVRATRGARR